MMIPTLNRITVGRFDDAIGILGLFVYPEDASQTYGGLYYEVAIRSDVPISEIDAAIRAVRLPLDVMLYGGQFDPGPALICDLFRATNVGDAYRAEVYAAAVARCYRDTGYPQSCWLWTIVDTAGLHQEEGIHVWEDISDMTTARSRLRQLADSMLDKWLLQRRSSVRS